MAVPVRCQVDPWLFVVAALPLLHCGRAKFDADCTMDARGRGRCDVTNSGSAAGAHCFRVRVSNKQRLHADAVTDVFCSGQIEPRATKRVPFFVADLRAVCRPPDAEADAGDRPWQDQCDFAIEEAAPQIAHDGAVPP